MDSELTYAARRGSAQCRELELLLLCACSGEVNRDRVAALVQEGVDWDALVEAAEFHSLGPILYCTLDSVCPELVPENIARQLRSSYRDSAKRHLIFTVKLLALLDAFESEGIAVVVLKGPALAESLYPDPALRSCSDLDLMVRKQDVPDALGVLTREGYKLDAHLARIPLHTLLRFHSELLLRQERTAPVDLQWDIGLADSPFRFDTEILWRSLSPLRIAEREVSSLSPESLMLFLCVHGARHLWSRLQWLGDVARLARTRLDWDIVMNLATEAGCGTPLLLGLLLAQELLQAPVPETILERARGTDEVERLASDVALRLDRIPPAEPEGLEMARFNARSEKRSLKKIGCYAALLRAPTDVELELLPLPEGLFFLYYPFRGARLALKYGLQLTRWRA
jgi:Uncharacterised nucleotidyltransferase